jgi:hypothetical protein
MTLSRHYQWLAVVALVQLVSWFVISKSQFSESTTAVVALIEIAGAVLGGIVLGVVLVLRREEN